MVALGRRSWLVPLAMVLAVSSCLAGPAMAAGKTGQMTVFWGRNKNEGTLKETCDTGLYTTVVISFYSVFGHGRYWGDLSGHDLRVIGADIKHCQSKNVFVFLSIGGAGKDYSLPTSQSAADVADNIWNAHMDGRRPGVFRPFGDAAVDGIDFFIDQGAPDHYDDLARNLYAYNKMYRARTPVRLTATVRCAFPDPRMKKALDTKLFERIHVRFYDDATCSYNHAGLAGVMAQWNKWTAKYPGSDVYLGLAAANVPGKKDNVFIKQLYYDLLPNVQKAKNYGGIMLWDRFYDKQTGYGKTVKYWA
ncbi:xylanase inhibitor protein 1 [Oryza glaberrima]|uniref:GH18 domain-containing protein n=2 Tax=Oryza TaxID=4527 RepID=A0A0D3HQ67_9ORYZ|nr:xylanase inhibitor protein 1 [Oryza glaberrima]